MYKEAFYKMAADQDNSLLKGLSIGAGSIAGLGGLLFANKKLGLLGKLVNKFKKPELKGIQLLGKPFVESDFKPGTDSWKEAIKYYKKHKENISLFNNQLNDNYIGSIYKTLLPKNKGYVTDLKRSQDLINKLDTAISDGLLNLKLENPQFTMHTRKYFPSVSTSAKQFLNKENRSLLAALLRLSRSRYTGDLQRKKKFGTNIWLNDFDSFPIATWEKLIQNKPLQLGPYWQYLDGKISRIPQQ